jgi:hypothetical protein
VERSTRRTLAQRPAARPVFSRRIAGFALFLLPLSLLLSAHLSVTRAQENELPEGGIKLGDEQVRRWRVGLSVRAVGGPCGGLFGTVPVPTDWPEQRVRVVEEDISPQVRRVSYRMLDNGVKQMVVQIPTLAAGETATALVTFEVTRSAILGPDDTSVFSVPKRPSRDVAKFLTPSPYIETRNGKIRAAAKEALEGKDDATDWEKAEAIYEWVRGHVEYTNGPVKGALAALEDGNGDCEELSSLFIALCRVNRIPARTVWVPNHCYAEFYLEDAEGNGHWFPCQPAGAEHVFGSMPDVRPILQKGDNFKVPEKKEPQRYVAELLKGKAGGGKPDVTFVRDSLPVE